jgi:hypothetical protein
MDFGGSDALRRAEIGEVAGIIVTVKVFELSRRSFVRVRPCVYYHDVMAVHGLTRTVLV